MAKSFTNTWITLLSIAFACAATGQSDSVYVNDDVVNAALAKGGVLVDQPRVRVEAGRLDKPRALPAQKVGPTIFYVTDGSGTFATGTHTHQLSKGELLIVPAGTPQAFSTVMPAISYLRIIIPVISPDTKGELTVVPADKVAATMKKAGPLAEGPGFRVSGGHRPFASRDASPVAEVHANEGDLFYIISGRSTQILGGAVVDGKETGPGQIRGPRTEGGLTYELGAGDIMWVPSHLPHWFPEIPEALSYLLVKVFY